MMDDDEYNDEFEENPKKVKRLDDGLWAVSGFKRMRGRIDEDYEDEYFTNAQYAIHPYQGDAIFFNARRVQRIGPMGEYGHDFGYPLTRSWPRWADTVIVGYGT